MRPHARHEAQTQTRFCSFFTKESLHMASGVWRVLWEGKGSEKPCEDTKAPLAAGWELAAARAAQRQAHLTLPCKPLGCGQVRQDDALCGGKL